MSNFSVFQPCFSPPPERDTKGKILCVFQGIGKFILLLVFLYFFVCSLDVLSSAFQLVGGMHGEVKGLGWEFDFCEFISESHNSASPMQLQSARVF